MSYDGRAFEENAVSGCALKEHGPFVEENGAFQEMEGSLCGMMETVNEKVGERIR